MKDIIWTIIIIWLVMRVVSMFRNSSTSRGNAAAPFEGASAQRREGSSSRSLDREGEYVDFEEIK